MVVSVRLVQVFLVLNYSYEAPPLPDVSFTHLREQRKVFFSSTVSNTSNVIWEFGDGATSTQRNPVHTYTTPGNFNVRLMGQNSCGADTTYITDIVQRHTENTAREDCKQPISDSDRKGRLSFCYCANGS
ncbi:MAG: PKD domain-containing protein [Chitinophagaceae bacterium]|nr:PKD domain-containing protein [Chitinophagaceae bacterium]